MIFPLTCCQFSVSSDFASEQGTEDALLAVLGIFARVAQLVEYLTASQVVTGSSPVSRSSCMLYWIRYFTVNETS